MPRMPGRWLTGGCGCGKRLKFRQRLGPDCCGHGSDPRRVRRRERRELARELAGFADEALEWAEMALPAAAECWPGE